MKLGLLKLVAALVVSAPAAFGHGDHRFPFFPFRPPFAPSFRIATPRISVELGGCRPVHSHCWTDSFQREWVAPVYQTCVVGYDHCGRPIYQRVLVRAGCWTTIRYRVCGCGARIRG